MKNNLVKILVAIGLIVAIALILIGVFDVGKIGFNKFSSKIKNSNLPILKCTFINPDDSNQKFTEFYDLNNYIQEGSWSESEVKLKITQDSYEWRYIGKNDGYKRMVVFYVDRTTGAATNTISKGVKNNATLKEEVKAWDTVITSDIGECEKSKKKNL